MISSFIFGQYQQYETYISPYLSAPIESGFFYFNQPNTIQPGLLYQQYKLNAPDLNNDMLLIDTHTDNLVGLTHYKYQQLYKTIPIEGAGCIEHFTKNGSLAFLNAKIADSINSDARPRLTPEEAIEDLISLINRDGKLKFAWESEEWEQQIRNDHADSSATWYPTPELIFAIDTMKNMTLVIDGSRYSLAYKIPITTILPTYETNFYYLDAIYGHILKVRSSHIDVTADVYGYGNRYIDTKWIGGFVQKHILDAEDDTRNVHTKKYTFANNYWDNMNDTKSGDSNWGNTYLTETSTHYHVSNTWDYFKNTFGRVGMDGLGSEVRVKTQYTGGMGVSAYNAFYLGNQLPNELIFGYSTSLWDLGMEPSVVAHEYTHGITKHTANLAYEYESGALNESFSDIFGTVIQAQTLDYGTTDWISGNHIQNSLTGTRDISDPNSRGQHWSGQFDSNGYAIYDLGQPDYYEGNYWCNCPLNVDYGGVHLNSGVQNKWFYLLCEGESNNNIQAIGMTKAAQIAYLALTSFLMNSSQYSDSKEATIQAAIQLFGECSDEHISTVDSWNFVGVNATHNCQITSIAKIIDDKDVLIFPNPTNSELQIEIPKKTEKPIKFYDIQGKLIHEIESNNLNIQTNVSKFENGLYLIKFDFEGQQIVKRLMIQK